MGFSGRGAVSEPVSSDFNELGRHFRIAGGALGGVWVRFANSPAPDHIYYFIM
jgi:hypothetical protein